jgi:hypothetical protein
MQRDRKLPTGDKRTKHQYSIPVAFLTFLLGCIISTSLVLNFVVHSNPGRPGSGKGNHEQRPREQIIVSSPLANNGGSRGALIPLDGFPSVASSQSPNPLNGLRILIAIASYGESGNVQFLFIHHYLIVRSGRFTNWFFSPALSWLEKTSRLWSNTPS